MVDGSDYIVKLVWIGLDKYSRPTKFTSDKVQKLKEALCVYVCARAYLCMRIRVCVLCVCILCMCVLVYVCVCIP